MPNHFKYMPIFRSRQHELKVLTEFNFGQYICPMLEIIKEKDRKNKKQSPQEIFSEIINQVQSEKVFIDLPVYFKEASNTQDEVIRFNREVIMDLQARIDFLLQFKDHNQKVIPVVASLLQQTGEQNTIQYQVEKLRPYFQEIAFRTFHNTFPDDQEELQDQIEPETDILIYDLDKVDVTNPMFRKHGQQIKKSFPDCYKALVRSAINEDVQNVNLENGEVIGEANNFLVEDFQNQGFNAFGDYAGIKKDDLTSGGTISPGFIFYDPYDNLYYGFKGRAKRLEEFEETIIPSVLQSPVLENLHNNYPAYIKNNPGIEKLESIRDNPEDSGKNQAKFKKISMDHYLHCIKTSIEQGDELPLSINE